jgi:hypothetical protein
MYCGGIGLGILKKIMYRHINIILYPYRVSYRGFMYDVLVFDGRLRWRELEEDEVCKEASNLFFFSFWDFDHDRLLGSEVVRGR